MKFLFGIKVMLLGMMIVFTGLIILIAAIKILSAILNSFTKKAAPAPAAAAPASAPASAAAPVRSFPTVEVTGKDELAVVAAITATVLATEGSKDGKRMVVRSVRKMVNA